MNVIAKFDYQGNFKFDFDSIHTQRLSKCFFVVVVAVVVLFVCLFCFVCILYHFLLIAYM